MAELRGYSVAMIGLKWWDHVYVVSNEGHVWSCFGRDSGGRLISAGRGDATLADCLAQPIKHPQTYAGVLYFVTGVCHQAANRILFASGTTVAGCKGYGASVFAWTRYGLGPWPQKEQCVKLVAGNLGPLSEGGGPDMPSQEAKLLAPLSEREELQALADDSLGRGYDPEKLERISMLRQALHVRQAALAQQLQRNLLTRVQYLAQVDDLFQRIYGDCEKILGKDIFEKLFGISLSEISNMVDRDLFLAGQ